MAGLKIVKFGAALVLSTTFFTAIMTTEAPYTSAKTTYKVLHGKLVNAKTKKVVKNYKVYNKKLYYNGNLKKGYKDYSKKLYYNGSLKKGYKTFSSKLYKNGLLFTGTYKSIYYKSGSKFTGSKGDKQYKNGKVIEEGKLEVISIN